MFKNHTLRLSSVFREALCHAYEVLETTDGSGVNFQDFLLFMEELKPELGKFSFMNYCLI